MPLQESSTFELELTTRTLRLRVQIARVLVVLGDLKRPTDLQRFLNIDPALAWGIFRAATLPSVFEASAHVPGPGAMRTFLRAAESANVSSDLLDSLQSAFDEFNELRTRYGGLRNGFSSLVNDLAESDNTKADLKQRRDAFRANGHIWGLQAGSLLNAKIVMPGEGTEIDRINLQGMRAVRKLRRTCALRVRIASPSTPDRERQSPKTRPHARRVEPLTLGDKSPLRGSGVLVDFCSNPPPDATFESPNPSTWSTVVQPQDHDLGGMYTFFVGYREFGYQPSSPDMSLMELSTTTTVPAERLVYDLLVHRALCDRMRGNVRVYAVRSGSPGAFSYSDQHVLPVRVTTMSLPNAMQVPQEFSLPEYPDLLDRVLKDAGHAAADFRIFRSTVDYPVLHAFLRLQMELDVPEAASPNTRLP